MSTEFELNETPIEDWIDKGVSFLQANVTIYRNPALYAEYQPLIEQIKALETELAPKKAKPKRESSLGDEALGDEAEVPAGEESLGEDDLTLEIKSRLDELYVKAEDLWKRYSEDAEVWTLRRLDEPEVQEVQKGMELPLPTQPKTPGANPSKQMQTAYVRKMEAFLKDLKAYTDEFNLRCLAIGVMGVVVQGEPKPAPSLEALRRLKARPGGLNHVHELVEALESLTQEGVNIIAPHRSGAGA